MNRFFSISLVVFFAVGVDILAQTPAQGPKLGPQHQRLGYFAGNWTKEGNIKPNPFMPAGRFTAKEHNEWMTGGFFLVSHEEWKLPAEQFTGLAVIGYDAEEGVYTDDEYTSSGEVSHFKGTVADSTWTWGLEKNIGPNSIKVRVTVKEFSATSYTFRIEVFPKGPDVGEPFILEEGKATKMN